MPIFSLKSEYSLFPWGRERSSKCFKLQAVMVHIDWLFSVLLLLRIDCDSLCIRGRPDSCMINWSKSAISRSGSHPDTT